MPSAAWIDVSRSETTSWAISLEIGADERPALGPDAGELQQVLDQHLHPLGRLGVAPQVVATLVREPVAVDLDRPLGEHLHLAQRLLEVVRRDRRELLELGVRALELRRAALERAVGGVELGVGVGELARVAKHAPQQHERRQGGERERGEDQPGGPHVRAVHRREHLRLRSHRDDLPARVLDRGRREVDAVRERPDVRIADRLGEAFHRDRRAGVERQVGAGHDRASRVDDVGLPARDLDQLLEVLAEEAGQQPGGEAGDEDAAPVLGVDRLGEELHRLAVSEVDEVGERHRLLAVENGLHVVGLGLQLRDDVGRRARRHAEHVALAVDDRLEDAVAPAVLIRQHILGDDQAAEAAGEVLLLLRSGGGRGEERARERGAHLRAAC